MFTMGDELNWTSINDLLPVFFLMSILLLSSLFMIQHLSHKNMRSPLCLISAAGLYFLYNFEQLALQLRGSLSPSFVRLFLTSLILLSLTRAVTQISRNLFSLFLLFVVIASGYLVMNPTWTFSLNLDPKMIFLIFSLSLLVFKLGRGRNYLLHRRFFYYFSIMNILSLLASFWRYDLLASTFDFFTCIFLVYFINLFLVETSFKSRMREMV